MIYSCVIDASVALKWFLPESDTAAADILLEKFLNGANLIAPGLLTLEVASALRKRVILCKELSGEEALSILRDLVTRPISLIDTLELSQEALLLAVKQKHSVYDSLYCVLAMDQKCDLVTADDSQVTKFGDAFPFIRHISTITP